MVLVVKNFDRWNYTKKKIDNRNRAPVKLGEVYWCSLGLNVGVEQNGRSDDFQRPVVIIKKFSDQITLVAPLTTKIHGGDWYLDISFLHKPSQIILNQIRPVDTKRLVRMIEQIPEKEARRILSTYIELIST